MDSDTREFWAIVSTIETSVNNDSEFGPTWAVVWFSLVSMALVFWGSLGYAVWKMLA